MPPTILILPQVAPHKTFCRRSGEIISGPQYGTVPPVRVDPGTFVAYPQAHILPRIPGAPYGVPVHTLLSLRTRPLTGRGPRPSASVIPGFAAPWLNRGTFRLAAKGRPWAVCGGTDPGRRPPPPRAGNGTASDRPTSDRLQEDTCLPEGTSWCRAPRPGTQDAAVRPAGLCGGPDSSHIRIQIRGVSGGIAAQTGRFQK